MLTIDPRRLIVLLSLIVFAIAANQTASAQPPKQEANEPLVRRHQVQLTLAGAERAIAASRAKAAQIGVNVNIAVVDDGGHLLAFVRMDGARPGSVYTSMTKATTAATKRGATGPLPDVESPNTHLSLAVENAAAVSGGKFTTLKGGVPIVIDDQVIGAIGVGGATGEQDAEVAQAGVDALTKAVTTEADTTGAAQFNALLKTLAGTWIVEKIGDRGVSDDAHPTIEISPDGTVSGTTGVNRYRCDVTTDGGRLQFAATPLTRRSGPSVLMEQESRFLKSLARVERFVVDEDGQLHLTDAEGQNVLSASPKK